MSGAINKMNYEEELENLKEEGFDEKEIIEAQEKRPEKPSFPILIFMVAITKDIADWITLGIGGTIINFIAAPILYFYMRKHGGRTKKKMYKKFIAATVAGFVPGVNMIIPEWSIFVIMTYHAEQESAVKIINFADSFAKKTA